MSPEARERVRDQLKIDEGVVYEVYLDHLGLPTCGIGHLVIEGDLEHGEPVGFPVPEERVNALFSIDLNTAIEECKVLYGDEWDAFPEEVQEILVNMLFNLGRPRLSQLLLAARLLPRRGVAVRGTVDQLSARERGTRQVRQRRLFWRCRVRVKRPVQTAEQRVTSCSTELGS